MNTFQLLFQLLPIRRFAAGIAILTLLALLMAGGIAKASPFSAATMLSFSVALEGSDVHLHWETASEVDMVGFNLYRSLDQDQRCAGLFIASMPSQSGGDVTGGEYNYVDRRVPWGHVIYYSLASVESDGSLTCPRPRVVRPALGTTPMNSWTSSLRRPANIALASSATTTGKARTTN